MPLTFLSDPVVDSDTWVGIGTNWYKKYIFVMVKIKKVM